MVYPAWSLIVLVGIIQVQITTAGIELRKASLITTIELINDRYHPEEWQ